MLHDNGRSHEAEEDGLEMKHTKWSKDGLAYHPASDTIWRYRDGVISCLCDPWDVTPEQWQAIVDGECEYVMGE